MNTFFTVCLYTLTIMLLILSFIKDRAKTKRALKKSWRMFVSVLPQFIAILGLTGLILAYMDRETIQKLIGTGSGGAGLAGAALVGAVALMPVLIAFPLVSELLKNGAGLMQMTVFLSTLTSVGLATLPLESKYLGKKTAVLRNLLAFGFSFVTAYIVAGALK